MAVPLVKATSLTKASLFQKFISQEVKGNLCLWLVVLISFSYPVTGAIITLLDVPSTPVNIGIRVIYVVLSVYLIFCSLIQKYPNPISKGVVCLLLFWLIYAVRLIHDISFEHLSYLKTDAFFVYSFAFGNCMLPAIAIVLTGKFVDINKLVRYSFIVLCLGNLLALVAIIYYQGFNAELFAARVVVAGEDSETSVLNPISLAYYGEVLALFAGAKLLINKEKNIFIFLALPLGTINVFLGASRGPVLTLILILFLILLYHFRHIRVSIIYVLKVFGVILLFTIAFNVFLYPLIQDVEFELINRMFDFLESRSEGGKEVRDYMWESAWQIFVENPVFGGRFVEATKDSYPHNVYLEVFMATGLVGAFVFYPMLFFLFHRLRLLLKQGKAGFLFAIAAIATLVSVITSGGLFLSVGFWAITSYILSIRYRLLRT